MDDKSTTSNVSFEAYDNYVYRNLLFFNGYLAWTIGGFGIYITWFWTPKIFEQYRYFLFNIAVWAFLFDIHLTLLYTPWILFPAVVNCATGILQTSDKLLVKIWFDFFLFFYGGTAIAIFSAFIYRLAALKRKLDTILSTWMLIFLGFLHFAFEVPTMIFFHMSSMNTTAVEEAIIAVMI